MKPEQTEQFLNFCCEMGRQLIRNGAEIYRVEDSARRLIAAYGYEKSEVFAIPACVILNIEDDTRNYTKSVRIRSSSNNLDKLERINALCRRLCRDTPPVEEAQAQLRAIIDAQPYADRITYLAHAVVALFFTLFWGGRLVDGLVAIFCGLAVKATVDYMNRVSANLFFTYVCASMLLVSVPVVLTGLGLSLHIDMIIIGASMLLVPGIAITNAMRDVLAGDFLTALTRVAEVIIVSMAIAIGIAIPFGLSRLLTGGVF